MVHGLVLDFDLTDEGTFRLKQFGEQTGPEILERGYPLLSKTLESEVFAEHAIEGAADPQRTSAITERGKELQSELGGSGAHVDAIVEQVASKRLRRCELRKKSKPN